MTKNQSEKIKEIITYYSNGGMIIVTDDEDRENEGDLMISSQCVSTADISFMARFGRGLICISIDRKIAERLSLPLMTEGNDSQFSTAFTISVDGRDGTTTGISASDRFKTIRTIVNPDSKPEDLLRPGHMFPLIAADGGLNERMGHTEAAVDLAKAAGHISSGVICEIMSDDGTMACGDVLKEFSERHKLPVLTIRELKEYLDYQKQNSIHTYIPTVYGEFNLYHFSSGLSEAMPHVALVHKDINIDKTVTLRIHSECLTGDLFGSLKCDCGDQLKEAMKIVNRKKGILIYLRQEGRGIGLAKKMEAYRLQDNGLDTVEANLKLGFADDERNYLPAVEFLEKIGIRSVNLLTNNPDKISSLESRGVEVIQRIALEINPNRHNINYMKTKKSKMSHILNI